jgi:ferritin
LRTSAHFEVAEDAVKLSLEQEEQATSQINALVSMGKAESDYTADNFLQWFIKEKLEDKLRLDRPELAQEWDKIKRRERQAGRLDGTVAAGCSACRRGQSAARGGISASRGHHTTEHAFSVTF